MPLYNRSISEVKAAVETVSFPTPLDAESLRHALEEQVGGGDIKWLLCHCDDGVIWGAFESSGDEKSATLRLCSDCFPTVSPSLRPETLQQARLFGEGSELLLWRDGKGFQGRWVREKSDNPNYTEAYDERVMLWGDHSVDQKDGFTLWEEGAQGMRHAVPCGTTPQPPRLVARHYLAQENAARVALSRLVALEPDSLHEKSKEVSK